MRPSGYQRPLLGVDLDNVLSASDSSMMVALERVTGRPISEAAASSYEALLTSAPPSSLPAGVLRAAC